MAQKFIRTPALRSQRRNNVKNFPRRTTRDYALLFLRRACRRCKQLRGTIKICRVKFRARNSWCAFSGKLVLAHYGFTTQSRTSKQGRLRSVCSLTRGNRGAIAGLSNNEDPDIARFSEEYFAEHLSAAVERLLIRPETHGDHFDALFPIINLFGYYAPRIMTCRCIIFGDETPP